MIYYVKVSADVEDIWVNVQRNMLPSFVAVYRHLLDILIIYIFQRNVDKGIKNKIEQETYKDHR